MNTFIDELRSQLAHCRNLLRQDLDNLPLTGRVADLHLQLGEFAQARMVLEKALARWPSQPQLLSHLASVAMVSGDPGLAIHLLNNLVEEGDDDPILRYNLAYAYLYAGQADKAKQELLEIKSIATHMPHIYLLLARAQHYLGEIKEAIENAQQYVKKHPDDPDALGILALLNLDAANADAARTFADKTLALSQTNLNALVTLGSLALSKQDAEQAAMYFKKAVNCDPKSGRGWGGMGLANMLRANLVEAVNNLKLAVKYTPNHIDNWHSLAWCQLLKNDLQGAEKSFNRSMEIDQDFSETHGGLAVVHVMQNRLELAGTEIERTFQLNAGSFMGQFARSLLLSKTDPDKAQAIIEDILASRPAPQDESLQALLTRIMAKNLPWDRH